MKLLAKTLAGLEDVLAEELRQLGAQDIKKLKRAVAFTGDKALMYRANLELRTALRILCPIYNFTARNENQLYQRIQDIDWQKHLKVQKTLAVDATTFSDTFRHSKYVALKVKDAIVDQFRQKTGRRPNVEVYRPYLRVNIHIHNHECSLSLDSSGDSLHKREYRLEALDAPVNEVLAAGMVLLSGWKKDSCFIDPMCGSGTILIEAAMYATGQAPQLNREYLGFKRWPDFDESLWQSIVEQAKNKIRPFEYGLYGFDKDFRARRIAQHNSAAAGLEETVQIKRSPFERLEAPEDKGLIIMNPPYDERMKKEDIDAFYTMMGDRLKKQFNGYDAWIISSNAEALKNIGLRTSKKMTLYNGALECKFHRYELYQGSKKQT